MVEMPKEFVPEIAEAMDEPKTFTGNRALAIEEPLIFEIGSPETSGVDFEDPLILSFSPRGEGTPELPSPLMQGPQPAPSPLGERAGVRGDLASNRLGGLGRSEPIGLPGLSEPEAIRHYVRLSQKNYSIDSGIFPLGSCTMKHNPRLNEKMARLPGFADIHPLQPEKTVRARSRGCRRAARCFEQHSHR